MVVSFHMATDGIWDCSDRTIQDVLHGFGIEAKHGPMQFYLKLSYLCHNPPARPNMNVRNFSLKHLLFFTIFVMATFSCGDIKEDIIGSGVLKGKISIGPLCPVERIPPDPACLPTAETYKAWAISIWTLNKKAKLASLDPKLDGAFQVSIPAGQYIIDFDVARNVGVGGSNLPATISIADKDTTTFNINIDTGIR